MSALQDLASVFKALADPTRLRILRLLLEARVELCVCELVDCLEEPQYNISKHVNALKAAGLLKSRRDGRWVYYQPVVTNEQFFSTLTQAISSIPSKQLRRDRREFDKRLRLREGGKCLRGIQKEHLLEKAAVR